MIAGFIGVFLANSESNVIESFDVKNENTILIFSLLYFLIHNFTNDLIYSPDTILFFVVILGIKDSITNQVNLEKL